MKNQIIHFASFVFSCFLISCGNGGKNYVKKTSAWEETVKKHTDTTVSVYGKYAAVKLPITNGVKLWNPTQVVLGPKGIMYVANYTGEIFSLHDTDGDGLEDSAKLYCNVKNDSLRYPTSMTFKGNKLFVGTTQEIRVYEDLDGDEVADKSETFFKGFPYTMHPFDWTFGLEFGPDGYLYAILCTDSWNDTPAPDPEGLRGSILKIASDGSSYEKFASGLRFAYSMKFNKEGDLFFSDNRGNENKYEELNWAKKDSFYGNNLPKYPNHAPTIPPILKLRYGFAPTGITFNKPDNDFDGTAGDLFIAFYGPDGQWGDGSISRVHMTKNEKGNYDLEEFPVADKIPKLSDVAFSEQGNLYVAQFGTEGPAHTPYKEPMGGVYCFIEAPWVVPADPKKNTSIIFGNIHHGEEIFNSRACATCHSVDDQKQLLGPPLLGVGDLLSKDQLLQSITNPDRNIKTGFDQYVVTKKDGTVLHGRMVTSNGKVISLMTVGNQVVTIKRDEIKSNELITKSLMPSGLLSGLTDKEVNDLLGYLQNLKMEY